MDLLPHNRPYGPFQRTREGREKRLVFPRERRDPTDFKPFPIILVEVPVVSAVPGPSVDIG